MSRAIDPDTNSLLRKHAVKGMFTRGGNVGFGVGYRFQKMARVKQTTVVTLMDSLSVPLVLLSGKVAVIKGTGKSASHLCDLDAGECVGEIGVLARLANVALEPTCHGLWQIVGHEVLQLALRAADSINRAPTVSADRCGATIYS